MGELLLLQLLRRGERKGAGEGSRRSDCVRCRAVVRTGVAVVLMLLLVRVQECCWLSGEWKQEWKKARSALALTSMLSQGKSGTPLR